MFPATMLWPERGERHLDFERPPTMPSPCRRRSCGAWPQDGAPFAFTTRTIGRALNRTRPADVPGDFSRLSRAPARDQRSSFNDRRPEPHRHKLSARATPSGVALASRGCGCPQEPGVAAGREHRNRLNAPWRWRSAAARASSKRVSSRPLRLDAPYHSRLIPSALARCKVRSGWIPATTLRAQGGHRGTGFPRACQAS